MTLKSRLSLWFSGILAASLLVSGLIFTVTYYWVSLVNIEKFIIRESGEIQEKHLVTKDGVLLFKKDENGKTLAGYLIDEGLSAKVFDVQGNAIGSYGVFNSGDSGTENLVKNEDLEKVKTSGHAEFRMVNEIQDKSFLVYIKQLVVDEKYVGFLVVASNVNIGQQMLMMVLVLLAVIIPASIIASLLMVNFVVGREFEPLEKILEKMERVELGTLKQKMIIKGSDRDELVRLAKSYNRMVERLDIDVRKQKEFIANASHELKSPLTRAILKIETARIDLKKGMAKEAEEKMTELQTKLKDYGDMLTGLLEIAKIKEGNTEISTIKVKESFEEIMKEIGFDLKEKKLKIKTQIPDNLVFLFPTQHWQTLAHNLINNAIKYSTKGTKIEIRADTNKGRGYVTITNEVRSQVNLRKIWDRFYTKAKKNRIDGYGIGLSLVREIAEYNNLNVDIGVDGGKFEARVSGFRVKETVQKKR